MLKNILSKLKKRYLLPFILVPLVVVTSAFKNDFFEIAKQIEIFTTLYKTLNANYVDDINPGEIMTTAIKNTLTELDPYTVFFNEQDVIRYKINGTGEYTGIGASIKRIDGRLIIREPYKGYAADKAGFKAGDEIISIDGVQLIDFKEDASELLRGNINTEKSIVYKRQNKKATTNLKLNEVEIKAVPFYKKINNDVGYIVLSQFDKKAGREVRDALLSLKNEGATKIVLDLRDNPGGFLVEAIKIVNFFVPKGELIVSTKAKAAEHNQTYLTTDEPIDTEIPLTVLINEKSASASEIVSGALQDLDRAVIIGNRSFGKGLVQRPIDLVYNTQLKVTISRYFTPSGRCIQALDYTNKDAEGKAIKKDKTAFKAFLTKKGRTVYDGGGIQPDIEIKNSQLHAITKSVIDNDFIFNYATDYYFKYPDLGDKIPVISEADFTAFKNSLTSKINSESESEKLLQKTIDQAKKEEANPTVLKQYEALLEFIQKEKLAAIDLYKEQIKNEIVNELIKRYQYREGFYNYQTTASPEIKKAIEILNSPLQYQQILKK